MRILFIVIVGVGLAGIIGVFRFTMTNSANPVVLKQQLAIAESLLEEITSKPLTYCDLDDARVLTATSATVGGAATQCASNAQALTAGPSPNTETRYASPYLDTVADYHGFSMNGIRAAGSGTAITGLENYNASVALSAVGSTGATNVGISDDVVGIDVTVSAPGQADLVLTAYRYRYAPNAP